MFVMFYFLHLIFKIIIKLSKMAKKFQVVLGYKKAVKIKSKEREDISDWSDLIS